MKRSVDMLCAGTLLLLSLPVLLLCALVIKLESRGPVLFRQPRMGRNFRTFRVVKLRTMEHRIPGSQVTLGEDPRITRAGRWLRRTKLDELPQLWNVLRGEMSLVGPRPVIPAVVRHYRAQYRRLLTVRPGLTDPATLKYHNECDLLAAASDPLAHFRDVVTPDKLRLSAAYLERATVWSDFDVFAQTVATVLVHSLGRALSMSGRFMQAALRPVALNLNDSTEQDAAVLR
jgi:lipopolysaccharide/colanic/teichoic acid biosynthesis glycosyltransferase